MADTATVLDNSVRLPYEGSAMSVQDAADSLFAAMDSDEESPDPQDEATDSAEEEVQPDESEEEDSEETDEEPEDESAETDETDEESESTRDDADQEADAPLAEKEKRLEADYTRKTQALAEERKAIEAEATAYRAKREEWDGKLAQLEGVLHATLPAEPDWDTLRAENPAEFAAQWADHQRRAQDLAAVQAERARVHQEAQAEQEKAFKGHLEAEKARLLEAIPEWRDDTKAATEKKALMEYAKGLGFTDEDLSSVYDHRLILLLRKAERADKMAAKGREVVEQKKAEAPKVLKPGNRDTAPKKSQNVRAKIAFDRLRKSGRHADAAAYILETMPDDF